MNKYALTTVAAIPQAGGQAASLAPERNEGWDGIMKEGEQKLNALGYEVKDGLIEKTANEGWGLGSTATPEYLGQQVAKNRQMSRLVQMFASSFGPSATVQMKAPYFDEDGPLPVIDLGEIGGTGA